MALWVVGVHGWEPYFPDATQKRFEYVKDPIDHLEPYTVPTRETWKDYYLAEFAEYPVAGPGHEWRIYRDGSGKYRLRIHELVWNQLAGRVLQINEVESEIPESLAVLVYEIWTNALFQVKYSRSVSRGFDGTTYRFSTYLRGPGWFHGTTWSPSEDLPPKWLVEISKTILRLAENEADMDATIDRLKATRDKLFHYWNERGEP